MPTANEFIDRALQRLGVIDPTETASAEDADHAFAVLNELIDDWATQRQTIFYLTRTTQTLTSGTASYTVGSGGTVNIIRPLEIDHIGLILDTGAATPVEVGRRVFTDQEWAGITQKTLQSNLIQGIWYDHNWSAGLARIYPWPIPSVSTTQLVLYTPTALTEFADLSTDYTFPPAYRKAIRANLALELSADYPGATVPPQLRQAALEALAHLKRGNLRLSEVEIDRAILSRRGRTLTASAFASGDA